jgi:hypothetical protein
VYIVATNAESIRHQIFVLDTPIFNALTLRRLRIFAERLMSSGTIPVKETHTRILWKVADWKESEDYTASVFVALPLSQDGTLLDQVL